MRRSLALLRPEPGWSATAAVAKQYGLAVIGHPLFVAESLSWTMPEGQFDALLIGSAAAFRHGGPQLAALTHLPVHAVGQTTAEAARAAGFDIARTGERGLQALLDRATGETLRFLRLGGEEQVPLALHPGQSIVERAVYRMVAQPLASDFTTDLATHRPLVALHSAAAARQFAHEVDRLGIPRGEVFLLVFGPRIAKAAGLGWAAVHIADTPSDAALLAKAAALCK